MIKIYACSMFMFFICFQVQAQQPDDSSIYNAYTLSKKLMEYENRIGNGERLSNKDSNNLQKILGLLIWYADLQDYEKKYRISTLNSYLKKYKKLSGVYEKLYVVVSDTSKFLSLTAFVFDRQYGKLFTDEPPVKDELYEKYKNKDSLNRLISSLIRDSSDYEQAIKNFSEPIQVNADSLLFLSNKFQQSAKSKEDSLLYITDTLRVNKKLADYRSLNNIASDKLRKTADALKDNRQKLLSAHDSILNFLKTKKTGSKSIKAFIQEVELNPSNTVLSKYENSSKVDEEIKQTQYYKEAATNEANSGTLKFKLPSQSEIIDAVAIYLAKRVKQESIMWFFETIKKNANQYELIQTFFPNTITLLQSNEVYEIPNLGSQWRYALSKDFVKMPRNVISSNWFKKWVDTKAADGALIMSYLNTGFDISELLMQRYNYRNLIKQMHLQLSSDTAGNTSKNVLPKDIFSLLYAINEECFMISKKDTSYRLLKYEDFRQMNKDEIEIMMSLIDMKYGSVFSKLFKFTDNVFQLRQEDANSVRRWLGGIENGIKQFEKIQSNFNQTQEEINKGKKEDAMFSLFNLWESVNTLFDMVIPDSTLKPVWMKGVNQTSEKVKQFTKRGFEVYNQISLKNYAGAVNTVISILEDFFYINKKFSIDNNLFKERLMVKKETDNKRQGDMRYPQIVDTKIKGDTISFKQTGIEAAILFERDRHAIQLIRKLAGFLNDVMLTTDSRQLAKVVESYALPPGSYKRKRNSWWSLDLNAFAGAYSGYEFARKKTGPASSLPLKSEGWVYGVTAPIGISLSKTFGRKFTADSLSDDLIRNPDKIRLAKKNIYKRGTSTFTLMASVIDIGAVVSYRFNNTRDSVLPQQVRWEQVFSPGIMLACGFRNTPIVINAGYQYTPQLRKIDSQVPDPKNRQYNANRFFIGLMFDLPLANLWQRSFYAPKMTVVKNK